MRYASPRLLRAIIVCIIITAYCCWGLDVISSSKLEKCIRDGTQANTTNTDLSCLQKLVVTVTVDSGDSLASQNVDFSISCIGSSTGACPCPCNYVLDSSCTCRDLASSLTVTLTKGPLWASYPLQYLQSFNYKPYEAIIRPGAGQCRDGDLETSPTCGWYYTAGVRVPDSQGFICSCDASQIWDDTFGTNKQRTRANLDCDFFSDPLDILIGRLPCSAHCLMMDPHWYGGYSLGEASLQFIITAALSYSASSGSSSESITISPAVPTGLSVNQTLLAKLLGDLAGYTQLPVLSEKVLMIPHPKSGQTVSQVFANRTEWMLMDRSRISFDGSECDKVGTSFTAFRFQASACKRAPQVCLTNQLRDVLEADQARVAQGRVPLYLVSQYTNGLDSQLKSFAGGPLSFALPVTGIRSSVVQLEAVADSIKLIVNVSPGKILAARMCTFADTSCGGFEASASRGYLQAWLSNLGTLDATYTITVSNCSVSVTAVPAQRVAIPAKGNGTIAPFQIFVEDDTAVADRYCWLTMIDSKGAVTDRVEVPFFTNATKYETWPTGGLDNNGTGVGTLDNVTCDVACSNKWDLICQIRHGCWRKVGSIFGLILGAVGGTALLGLLAMKFGLLTTLLQMCGVGGGGGGSGLLSCCGGGNSSKETQSKGSKNRPRRYELEERDSASGSTGERRGHKAGRSGKSERHSGHKRSQSHSSTHSSKYNNRYDNELFDKPGQPPGVQRIGRSTSRTSQSDGQTSRYSKKQGSGRESKHSSSGVYSADEQSQQQYKHNRYHEQEEGGAYLDESGQDYNSIYHSYEGDNHTAEALHQTGFSSSRGKKHKGSRHSSSSSRGVPAVPWDESAAGGGHLPSNHAAWHSRRDNYGGFEDTSEDEAAYQGTLDVQHFELELPAADASALVSRSSPGQRSSSSSIHRTSRLVSRAVPLAAASSPGRLPAAAAARGPVVHQVRGTSRLSELVRSAQSASELLSAESDDEIQPQQQQQALYLQPSRAATMPGSMSSAAAASVAAAAAGSSVHRGSVSPPVRGRRTLSKAAKSPAVLRRSRESSGDSTTLQSDHFMQQQQLQEVGGMVMETVGSSSSSRSKRRSRSQPPYNRHVQQEGSESDDGAVSETYSLDHPYHHHHHHQQQQQQQQQQQMFINCGIPQSSTLVHRHSAVGNARAQQEQQQQQQQQQQSPQVVSGGARMSPATRSSAVHQSGAAAVTQQQQQQQGTSPDRQSAVATRNRHTAPNSPDGFFAPYDDESLHEGNESDADHAGSNSANAAAAAASLRRGIAQQQQVSAPQGSRISSSSRQQHMMQQQAQQVGHGSNHRRASTPPAQQQQQLLLRGTSAPIVASTTSKQHSPFSQHQQPVSKWVVMSEPISTAARPHLAPFNESTGDADPVAAAAAAAPAVRRDPQDQLPTAAHFNHHHHQQQQQQGAVGLRQASASVAAIPPVPAARGSSSAGRHRFPTEPGSTGRQQQQQRPSLVSLASRVPGFVRSAAAGLSNSGHGGSSSSPGRPSSSRTAGQGTSQSMAGGRRQLQQDLNTNPLFDES